MVKAKGTGLRGSACSRSGSARTSPLLAFCLSFPTAAAAELILTHPVCTESGGRAR